MKVYTDINALPDFTRAVITIGTFDGVHSGHRQIISQLKEEAASINGTPVLITFYPHPKQVVSHGDKPLYILNTQEEKYELLNEAGIDNIVVVPFSQDFASQSASNYIRDFLVAKFHPHTIIIGYDHRFGCNREGDYKLLEDEAGRYGFLVKEIPEKILRDVTISSTKIRESLLAGAVETANDFLSYRYFFTGLVVTGNKLGRAIDYPTANIHIPDKNKLVPGNGVYSVDVTILNHAGRLKGMMNIGTRPTIDGVNRVIEVNIFNFNNDLYDTNVTVYMKKRLRGELKFNSLEELKVQLGADRKAASAD